LDDDMVSRYNESVDWASHAAFQSGLGLRLGSS
jgi:hypothetical protein